MSTAEFMAWVRREHHDLLVDRMVSILDRAEERARQAVRKHSCSCGCGQKCAPGVERKDAEHALFFRRILRDGYKSIGSDGRFFGYASVWGDVDGPGDCVGDVVCRGAFKDHVGGSVPLLWMHDLHEPVGRARDLREDAYGLRFAGQIELESPRGKEAHAFLKNDLLDSFSIGYRILDAQDRPGRRGRLLTRLQLHEISVVSVACDAGARMVQ